MGIKVMIKIRGLTDWIEYGQVLTSKRAEILVKELRNKVQIITLPYGKNMDDIEDLMLSEDIIICHSLDGDRSGGEYVTRFYTGFSEERKDE